MHGLYISFPFCRQKCTYCNFASGVFADELRARYVRALGDEMQRRGELDRADTLYLGGGTPSLLTAEELQVILGKPREWREATMETAPGDVSPEKAELWRRWGIDRVSLGVQSFDRRVAGASGRKHTAEQVQAEIQTLRQAGIRRINVDLIAGLAHQTEANWAESFEWIERLEVDHASVYMLEADDESRLGAEIRSGGDRYGAGAVPDDEAIAAFYEAAVDRLAALGVERYEISNFARPGAESLHNLKYWTLEPYRGLGSDAHSFTGCERQANVRSAAEYTTRWERGESPALESEPLDDRRRLEDRLLAGLRLMWGVELEPPELALLAEPIRRAVERGWLEQPAPDRLRLTRQGVLFSNEVFLELLFD